MKCDRYDTLLKLCYAMEWAIDADAVHQRLIDAISECFRCDAANLHLFDADGKTLVRHAAYDGQLPKVQEVSRINLTMGRMPSVIEGRNVVITDLDHPHVDDEFPDTMLAAGFKNVVTFPLISSSGVLGVLSLVYRESQAWSDDDVKFLLEVGSVLGTFIQRLQGAKKELDLRILHERKQLSGEIHDTLSQMVSTLAIRADIARSCHEDGDDDKLSSQLDMLSDQARVVTQVLRGEILSLRASLGEMSSVYDCLAGCLSRFKEQWGLDTQLVADGTVDYIVPEYVGLQMERIVSECLQNVLRHSHAEHVVIIVEGSNGQVHVTLRDDGDGFDVDAVPPECLGIRIMRERAETAGGSMAVVSSGAGTTVLIDLPATCSTRRGSSMRGDNGGKENSRPAR